MSLFVPSLYSFGGCIFVVNRWAIPATKRIYTAHTFFYIYIVPVHHIQKIWFPTDRPPTNGLYRLNMYLSFDFIKRFFPIYIQYFFMCLPQRLHEYLILSCISCCCLCDYTTLTREHFKWPLKGKGDLHLVFDFPKFLMFH